ncbi:MAG: hypothetical protein Q8R92_07125 [Deltaproteobacteria bacterium]|nr:hypothetical protein [Deltaproteobacteria bacterium]
MDRLIDITDYLTGSQLVEDLSNPWVQGAVLAIIVITILKRWRALFTFIVMTLVVVTIVRVGFGGGSTGVIEQAPVFLAGLGLSILVAVYLFYVRR